MLKLMGREHGEDYSAQFLFMLNTLEGAVKFLPRGRNSTVNDAIIVARVDRGAEMTQETAGRTVPRHFGANEIACWKDGRVV